MWVGVSTDGGLNADASLRSLSGTTAHGSEIRFALDAGGGGESLPTVGGPGTKSLTSDPP